MTGSIDPFRGYATGLTDRLDGATIVVDHFHAVRLANAAIDDVRRRVQQAQLGHRGRKDDPLYRIRRTLLIAPDRLTDTQRERIVTLLRAGDPDGEVAATYLAKELLREVYAARSLRTARRRLERFYEHCDNASVRECRRLARTIRAWETEVLAFHTTGRSNGPTEGINLLIKKVKRVGHGFRNFANYRLRLVLHCGVEWHTAPTARVRGRQPRFIARAAIAPPGSGAAIPEGVARPRGVGKSRVRSRPSCPRASARRSASHSEAANPVRHAGPTRVPGSTGHGARAHRRRSRRRADRGPRHARSTQTTRPRAPDGISARSRGARATHRRARG
ncbi:MAG: hypothetical protein KatS3mg010_1451 [Acidimicrobiia bacterium]|nr:MAG: hypothetical protein KatS3mg010_1451 [Acidimicrobiia bacterium]